MNALIFDELTDGQQKVMLIAIQLHVALDDFRRDYLSDEQARQLDNDTLYALYDAVHLIEETTNPRYTENIERLVAIIPEEWEIPGTEGNI